MKTTRRSRMRALCAGLAAVAAAAAAGPVAAADGFSGELEIMIDDYWVLHLGAREGAWDPVRRSKPPFTFVDSGYVAGAEGDAAHLKLQVHLRRDGSRPPAHVFYDLDLARAEGGGYEGTYTVKDGAKTGAGALKGILLPPRPAQAPYTDAVAPGEHPRMLLRKSDVPALRGKLRTPLGEAFVKKARASDDLVVLGVLYQATGDAAYAERALRAIRGAGDIDGNEALTGGWGHQIVRVALAYDLCAEAWPEADRTWLRTAIRSRMVKRQSQLPSDHANYSPASNYYGPGFGSAALATLVLFGERGPCPPEPDKPYCLVRPDGVVPPAEDYRPGEGVPVCPLKMDALAPEWIYAGGFKPREGEDLLAPIGGTAHARPTCAARIGDGTREEVFRPVSHEPDRGYFTWLNIPRIDVTSAIGRIYHSVSFFFTVIENDAPRRVKYVVGGDHEESTAYLNGVRLEEGDIVNLDKGLYPLLVRVRIGQTEPWGREMIAPRFVPATEAEQKAAADALREAHADAVRFHATEVREWNRRGQEDLEALRMVWKGYEQMYWHYRLGIGDGGFQAEVSHYGNIAARYPVFYATCYRTAFGRNASPYPDATHLLPRRMLQGVFGGGKPAMMDLNVHADFDVLWCAEDFPLVPEPWKPSVLWAWNSVLGVDAATASDVNAAAAKKLVGAVDGLDLAATLVHYPVGMDPVHPSKGMPLTWAADTFGFYVFRSGWEGEDEFVSQVFLKARPIGGWNHPNAGAFRLFGLGHRWTGAPIDRSGYREEESVVQFPDIVTGDGNCGRLTAYAVEPDGSGSLAIDLNDVYLTAKAPKPAARQTSKLDEALSGIAGLGTDAPPLDSDFSLDVKLVESGKPPAIESLEEEQRRAALRATIPRLYGWYGKDRAGVDRTSALTGSRAFAFDYSNKSGAPCLMAMVDSIRGAGLKQWVWQLPVDGEYAVDVDGSTFSVRYRDASMKVTFISPAGVKPVFWDARNLNFRYKGGSKKGEEITRMYRMVIADCKDPKADFFAIVTVQRGAPPAVDASGAGLDARAIVGDRAIRYADGRLVIEPR